MDKSVEEVIEQWGILLADLEKTGETKEQNAGVLFSDIEIVVKYFDDVDAFNKSL